ncbi:hypothetical protein [Pseudomonas serbica]|uniref:hypothetical protein n=1 Tax=Pseudomonas serbica TaxID=2965074 RepID=UPI00237C1A37|nr:hypothetical protein [Pseudomonas serbica]
MPITTKEFALKLQAWLDPLDAAQVECDGMCRLISAVLSANDIEHEVIGGILSDLDGATPEMTHFWVELPNGYTIDYRARMWMGEEAQHGVFIRSSDRFVYESRGEVVFNYLPNWILQAMSGIDLESYPVLDVVGAIETRDHDESPTP